MRLLGVVTLLFAAALVSADDCACSKNQDDAPGGFFSFFTSYPTRVPCHVDSCTYIANTTSTDTGVSNINIVSFKGAATINIYDGDATGQPVFTINSLPDSVMMAKLKAFKSYNTYVTIVADETTDKTNLVSVVVVMEMYTGRQTTNPPTTTTPMPTTTPYAGNYSRNPALVALDLAVAVDTAGEYNVFQKMISVIGNFVNLLSVDPSANQTGSTRLSLQQLVSFSSDGILAAPWSFNVDNFVKSLNAIRSFGGSSFWKDAIDRMMAIGFSSSATRAHTERTYFIFAQSIPNDMTSQEFIDNYANKFSSSDIHVIVIDFAPSNNYFETVKDSVSNFDYYVYNVSDPNAFQNFMDKVLIGSDSLRTFGCASNLTDQTNIDSGPVVYEMPAIQSQRNNYCNFQNTIKTFVTAQGCIKFTVDSYELEVEKDYLKFYSVVDGKDIEQVSLTGIDVSKSEFQIHSNNTKIVFTTNENNVFNGFNLTASKCT